MLSEIGYRVEIIRDGGYFADLDALDMPSIDAKLDSDIHMSLSGRFAWSDTLQPFRDRLRLLLTLGGAEHRLGDFLIGTMRKESTETGRVEMTLEAYDMCYLLQSTIIEAPIHLDKGTNYITAIQGLLLEAGITLMLATTTTDVLQSDREDWEIGTSYLEIINELLAEISYQKLWFDATGYAILAPNVRADASNIQHRYGPRDTLIRLPATRENDFFSAPNVFYLICENPDLEEPLTAISVNDSPSSQLSVIHRGRRIVEMTKLDNVASQTALQDIADRMKLESMMRGEVAQVETQLEPWHGIGDIVAADHPLADGIWQETAWSVSGKAMRHTWQKLSFV